jgi:hypothetical protein
MTWKRTATVETSDVAHAALMISGFAVFRDAQGVLGWRKDAEHFAWKHSLPEDPIFAQKHLVAASGAVITLHGTQAHRPKKLLWLEPFQGTVQQEHVYPFKPSQYGFTAAEGSLFLHGEQQDDQWALLRISPTTGELLEQTDAPVGMQLAAATQRLYLSHHGEELFHTPQDRVQWTNAHVGPISGLSLCGNQLFFFLLPTAGRATWELAWWDANEAREAGRMPMEARQALTVQTGPWEGLASAHDLELGLWMLDLPARAIRWKLSLAEKEKLKAACWTPHGLVTAIKPRRGISRLELREPSTGELLETLANTRYDIAHLYWLEDRLVASAMDGLDAFAWEG